MSRKMLIVLVLGIFALSFVHGGVVLASSDSSASVAEVTDIRTVYNESNLWKVVRNNSPPSYFFGTIHIPAKFVWDIISEDSKDAFKTSDAVYTEIDFGSMDEKDYIETTRLAGSSTIQDFVNETMMTRLKNAFQDHKEISHWDWNKMRPSYLAYRLDMHYAQNEEYLGNAESTDDVSSFTRTGTLDMILDYFLYHSAREMGKTVGGVETTKNHFAPDENMPQDLAIYYLDTILQQYFEGGIQQWDAHLDEKLEEYFWTDVTIKRNKQMAKKSIEIMKKSPDLSNFFAFGAAHFRGPDNIVELVRKEGYRVLRVKVGDTMEPNVRSNVNTWYSSPVYVIVFLAFTIMI